LYTRYQTSAVKQDCVFRIDHFFDSGMKLLRMIKMERHFLNTSDEKSYKRQKLGVCTVLDSLSKT